MNFSASWGSSSSSRGGDEFFLADFGVVAFFLAAALFLDGVESESESEEVPFRFLGVAGASP